MRAGFLLVCALGLMVSVDAVPRQLTALAAPGSEPTQKTRGDPAKEKKDGAKERQKGKDKKGLRGQVPAKFDDTAAKSIFDKLRQDTIEKLASSYSLKDQKKVEKVRARPTIEKLAAKGFHMQLPRDGAKDLKKIEDLKKDVTISKDEKDKKIKRVEDRWSNFNPAKTKEDMIKGGKTKDPKTGTKREKLTKEQADRKVDRDKNTYKDAADWKKQQKLKIKDAIERTKTDGVDKRPLPAPTPFDEENLKKMEKSIGSELARKEMDTGDKQRTGALFMDLDQNKDGKLQRGESAKVDAYLAQYAIEGDTVTFDQFKIGVRQGRKDAKKTARNQDKMNKATTRKEEAKTRMEAATAARKEAKAAKEAASGHTR